MSTTFAILNSETENINLDNFKEGDIISDYIEDDIDIDSLFMNVAFRTNDSIYWTNQIAKHLNDHIKVYPIDNTSQGIFTIGDIRKKILKNKNNF